MLARALVIVRAACVWVRTFPDMGGSVSDDPYHPARRSAEYCTAPSRKFFPEIRWAPGAADFEAQLSRHPAAPDCRLPIVGLPGEFSPPDFWRLRCAGDRADQAGLVNRQRVADLQRAVISAPRTLPCPGHSATSPGAALQAGRGKATRRIFSPSELESDRSNNDKCRTWKCKVVGRATLCRVAKP